MRFFQSFLLSYSGFAILGMLAMGLMSWFLCRKTGVSPMKLLPLLVLGLVPLYLGAKLFGILSLCAYRTNIGRPMDWTVVKNSGIVFYGGLIGYLLFSKWAFPPYMQKQTSVSRGILAVCIPLFHGFARIGCYFGRCCYGVVLKAAWCAPFFEHRLPTQLLEAAFNFLLCGFLVFLFFKKKKFRCRLPRVYLWAYAPFRFFIEFFRDDAIRGFIGPLSFSQWVSVGLVLYLLGTHINRKRSQSLC